VPATVDSWAVFYADGSTFTSEQGTWAEAPAFGVFGVVYYQVGGMRLMHMEQRDDSQYRWPEHLVAKPTGAVEVHGVEAGGGPVKFGLWVNNDRYFTLFDAMRGREVTP